MQKRILFVFLILIVLAAAAFAAWPRGEKKTTEEAWSPPSVAPGTSTFRGPTGAPFVVGPKEPPPNAVDNNKRLPKLG